MVQTPPLTKSFNNAILTLVAKSSIHSKNAVLLLEAIRSNPEVDLGTLLFQIFNGNITVQAALLRFQISGDTVSMEQLPAVISIPFVYNLAEKIYNSHLDAGSTVSTLLEKLLKVLNLALTSYTPEQIAEAFPGFTSTEIDTLKTITSSITYWSTRDLVTNEDATYDQQPII